MAKRKNNAKGTETTGATVGYEAQLWQMARRARAAQPGTPADAGADTGQASLPTFPSEVTRHSAGYQVSVRPDIGLAFSRPRKHIWTHPV